RGQADGLVRDRDDDEDDADQQSPRRCSDAPHACGGEVIGAVREARQYEREDLGSDPEDRRERPSLERPAGDREDRQRKRDDRRSSDRRRHPARQRARRREDPGPAHVDALPYTWYTTTTPSGIPRSAPTSRPMPAEPRAHPTSAPRIIAAAREPRRSPEAVASE